MFKPRFKDNIFHYKLNLGSEDKNSSIQDTECSFCFIKESYEYLEENKRSFLSDPEINNLSKYEFRKKRHDYLLGRAAVKSILQKKRLQIKDFSVFNKITGKPFINHDKLGLSLSHSSNSACALIYSSFLELSIDMEYIINVDENTNFRFCLENEECLFLKQSNILNNKVRNTINWSSKESLAKFIGTGFNIIYEILEIGSVEQINKNILSIGYKNIKSAKTIVFIFADLVISVTIPYSLNIKNIERFLQYFGEYTVD